MARRYSAISASNRTDQVLPSHGPVIVDATFLVPRASFAEAALSFIGMGVAPADAEPRSAHQRALRLRRPAVDRRRHPDGDPRGASPSSSSATACATRSTRGARATKDPATTRAPTNVWAARRHCGRRAAVTTGGTLAATGWPVTPVHGVYVAGKGAVSSVSCCQMRMRAAMSRMRSIWAGSLNRLSSSNGSLLRSNSSH